MSCVQHLQIHGRLSNIVIKDPSINNKEQKSIINADIQYCLRFLSEINHILDSSQEKLNIQQLVFNTAIDYHEFALAINLI